MNTIEEIYEGLKSDFEQQSGITLHDGGDMALRFHALAAQLVSLQAQAEYVQRQCFPHTATGSALDTHAAQVGLTRLAGVKASGVIRVSVNSPAVVNLEIPAGLRFVTADEKVFVLTETGYILIGESYADIPAEAVEAGRAGNVPAGAIVYMERPPVGIFSCTNPAAFTGGKNGETDEELRLRIITKMLYPENAGNANYYRHAALSVPGVAAVSVEPRSRGRGTVDVTVASASGIPNNVLLSDVEAALAERSEIAVDVLVKAPTAKTVNVALTVTVGDGYDSAAVLTRVRTAIQNLFNGSLLAQPLRRILLGNTALSVKGVTDYSITSPASDVIPDADELPVLGTLTVTEA